MSDTPKPTAADAYETMEALLCEMQGLRDELVDVKRERDQARRLVAIAQEAFNVIHVEVGGWISATIDGGDK